MISKLPEGWEKVKLEELVDIRGGKRMPKGDVLTKDVTPHPYIRVTDFINNHNLEINSKFEYVPIESFEKIENYIVKESDIIISIVGTIGNVARIGSSLENANLSENCARLHNYNNVYDNYLYYYLISPIAKKLIYSSTVGAVQSKLPLKNIRNLDIILPSKKEQKAIADTLSSLDHKIELNNKVNVNLEKQVQAIFKHWFIDFEFPDENGNPYKSSGGEMIESELGMIPKGWKVGTVDDLGNVVGGSTPSRKKSEYFTTSGIPWITPKDLSNNKNIFINKGEEDITKEGFNSTSIKILPRGTVLFSSRAPIGYIGIAKNDVTTNQGFKSIIPCKEKGVSTGYIFNWLKGNVENIENRASGSTFKEISGGELKKVEAIIPDKKLLNKFEKLQNDYFNKIESNEDQNRVLNKLRDTLLPKLLSGEIRIPLD